LRFFRSFDPLPFDGRLLARPRNKQTLAKQLRSYLPMLSLPSASATGSSRTNSGTHMPAKWCAQEWVCLR
jgi:hypothetical protein